MKKNPFRKWIDELSKRRLSNLKRRLKRRQEILRLKADAQKNSHSLLWVWEFSKKAVLICFIFYVIVQIYTMFTMFYYQDFSYLGELINKTGEILQNCVFAYLIKAGLENVGKIWFPKAKSDDEETVG